MIFGKKGEASSKIDSDRITKSKEKKLLGVIID